MITLTSLHCYPVKGLRGIDLEYGRILPRGLAYDREWLVVDSSHRFITQRSDPLMATVTTRLSEDSLILEQAGRAPLHVPLTPVEGERKTVQIWRDTCGAIDQGDDAAAWIGAALSRDDLRLVRFALDDRRDVERKYLGDQTAEVGFADGYPYLVANTATLESLNQQLEQPVPMNRFRANLVLDGLPALDEHKLSAMRVPTRDVELRLPKPCQRCKVTTIDQQTGEINAADEPLRTLVRNNPFDHLVGGYFGQNGVPTQGLGNLIHVGDVVEVCYA